MNNKSIKTHVTFKIKTFRWLFYLGLFQTIAFFVIPLFIFHGVPVKLLLSLEILAALTFGVLFALYFLGINIYGLFVDKCRKILYIVMISLMTVWVLWAVITWSYIEYMDYLLQ